MTSHYSKSEMFCFKALSYNNKCTICLKGRKVGNGDYLILLIKTTGVSVFFSLQDDLLTYKNQQQKKKTKKNNTRA